MGSPVSPIVAYLYMEYFEQKALSTATQPKPKIWLRYVDDNWVVQREENKQSFLQHINSVDPAIMFTVENKKEDGAIPFMDTIVTQEADGKLSITVYRNPTDTNKYLQWDIQHHLSAKYSVKMLLLIGQKQCVTNLSYFKKKWSTSERLLPTVSIPNGPWTGWRKGLPSPLVRLMIGLKVRALQATNPLPMK